MSNTTKVILAVVSILLVGCICLSVICVGAAGVLLWTQSSQLPAVSTPDYEPLPTRILPTGAPGPSEPTETSIPPEPTATPFTGGSAPDQSAVDTLQTLEGNIVPENNPVGLAERFKGKVDIAPTVEPPANPHKTGAKTKFWVTNSDTDEKRQVDATLRYVNDAVYFWIEDGVSYNQSDLKSLADTFAQNIYPTDRKFFGSEWSPGIDGEKRLYVLYVSNVGQGIAGYFSSADEVPPAALEFSNAHEMFVLSADNINLGEEYTYGTMAHEFQHMIHFSRDRNEDTWVNEGFSMLAELLNKYDAGGFDALFVQNPDMQLTDWETQEASRPHYGAAFLYFTYFLGRFGDQATQAVVANPDNGMDSIDAVLKDLKLSDAQSGAQLSADDVFTDWTVANVLDDPSVAGGRYDYKLYSQAPKVVPYDTFNDCPVANQSHSVHQYGAQYIQLRCSGSVTFEFQGASEVPLLPESPPSGSSSFWSNQGDESNMSLSQEFDLSKASGAIALTYRTWFDIEKNYDYVYLSASEDGKTWNILKTPSGTDTNPTGANLGWGYTDQSNGWLDESVDLSAYAGKKVQIRFDYITDAAVNGRGMLIDNLAIAAIGYQSDLKIDSGNWKGEGFVRVVNKLPQTFRVTLIKKGKTTTVEALTLDATQHGSVQLDFGSDLDEVIVVVSGTTRFTTERAGFQFSVR